MFIKCWILFKTQSKMIFKLCSIFLLKFVCFFYMAWESVCILTCMKHFWEKDYGKSTFKYSFTGGNKCKTHYCTY